MSENENRNTRIKQQKNSLIKKIVICLVILVVLTVIFVYVNKSAMGTEINYNIYVENLNNGNIKEIHLNESKIQIYYNDGEAHWFYNRYKIEDDVVEQWKVYCEAHKNDLKPLPVLKSGTTTTISIFNILYPIFFLLTTILLIVFVVKQFKGANNKNFEFVKSRARIYPSKTKFSDVAGADEEKEELKDVVDFLKNPKKYTALGAKIPKGVILVGPPGTGKTLLARAVAGEANVPFFTISGSDFMELFVGVGASRVRDLFENAKKAKPCIIFIDEIDAVGRQRGAGLGGGNDEREQTLNQLLVQMDGFEENEGIIVMAATNRVDILDPALLRPGRFDRRINIHVPDIKGREEILKVHARDKFFTDEVNFKTIAKLTAGFTGAELENLLNEAAIIVAKENRNKINNEDIQNAIMKVSLGPQKRSRIISEEDKKDTAIHEAGHALVSRLAKEKTPVHEVSIIPRGGAGGYTVSADDDATVYFREKLLCKIQMLLGGTVAERLYVGDISTGASNDLKRASSIARRMVTEWGMSESVGMVYCGDGDEVFIGKSYQERVPYSENQGKIIDEEIKKIIDLCQAETEKILMDNQDKLMLMVRLLLDKETIYAEEVEMILNGKTYEEIVEYMENKNKPVSKDDKDNKNESSNLVDDLLKTAEAREKDNIVVSNKEESSEDNNDKTDEIKAENKTEEIEKTEVSTDSEEIKLENDKIDNTQSLEIVEQESSEKTDETEKVVEEIVEVSENDKLEENNTVEVEKEEKEVTNEADNQEVIENSESLSVAETEDENSDKKTDKVENETVSNSDEEK